MERPSEITPGAVFMLVGHVFGHIRPADHQRCADASAARTSATEAGAAGWVQYWSSLVTTYGAQKAGVPTCERQLSVSAPMSTQSYPSCEINSAACFFASGSLPAIGRAVRSAA